MSSWREERTFPEMSLECEGRLLEPLLRSRIFWPRLCPLGAKLLLPDLCVDLLCCLSCNTAYSSQKKIPAQGVSVSRGESKGRFVGWGFPCPLENLGRVSASEKRERRAYDWQSQASLWRRCYWTLKAQQMTQGCAVAFQLVTHSEPLRENTFWALSWGLSVCTMQVRAGVKQGDFFKINPGLAITHRLLECCPWQCASLRCRLSEIYHFCICGLSMVSLLGIVRRGDWTLCLYSACSYWSTLTVRVLL